MNAHQTNRFARELVENALLERGAGSVHTSENGKKLLVAMSMDNIRTVTIQVKAKTKGIGIPLRMKADPLRRFPRQKTSFGFLCNWERNQDTGLFLTGGYEKYCIENIYDISLTMMDIGQ